MRRYLPALSAFASAPALAAAPYPVTTSTIAASAGEPIPIALWQPATPGRYPLILISHGSGGSEYGHRSWAEHLARNGYVVAAPRHWGDSHDKPDGRGSDVQLVGRPIQASAALDSVLAHPQLKQLVDPQRIGMVGFSAGGYTTLVMAGARPDFKRWQQHCQQHASQDDEFCPTLVWRFLPRITRSDWQLPRETRIRAAAVMAPASILFDREGLESVKIPLRLYGAQDDAITPNAWHVSRVAAALPAPAQVHMVPGGHFVFLEPCSATLRATAPQLCIDAPGVDRAAIQRRIGGELVEFFGKNL